MTVNMWRTAPLETFVAFIESPEFKETAFRLRYAETISPESVAVYKAMFSKFLKYCEERHLTLFDVEPIHIYGFLTQVDPSTELGKPALQSDIQHRYLRILERTFHHMGVSPRPTDDLMFGAMKEVYQLRGRNKSTVALTESQIQSFLDSLPIPTAQDRPGRPSANWKRRRDRALQCTILGAGLKVAEVVDLRLDEVDNAVQTDGSIQLTLKDTETSYSAGKHPTFRQHTTFVQPRFVDELVSWIHERRRLPICGELVFPNGDGTSLNKASVYRQIRKTFERSGIDLQRMGGRTLRNTFAVQELVSGTALEELSTKMGFVEDRSVELYAAMAKKRGFNGIA